LIHVTHSDTIFTTCPVVRECVPFFTTLYNSSHCKQLDAVVPEGFGWQTDKQGIVDLFACSEPVWILLMGQFKWYSLW